MKEIFKEEIEISKKLNQYKVDISTEKLNKKRLMYERFLHYLASPTKDPLENVTASASGLLSLKLLPIPCVIILAFFQGLFF